MPRKKSKAKYSTLAELSEAFKSGELDDSYCLIIDKGGAALHLHQDGQEDTENERFDHCQELFDRDYGCCIEELMELAGIPAEWC